MRPLGRGSVMALTLTVTALACHLGHAGTPPGASSDDAPRPWLREGPPVAGEPPVRRSSWGLVVAGVVLAALAGGALYRRWQTRSPAHCGVQSRIRVLYSTQVGPKSRLVTVLIGDQVLLLGVTDTQVSSLGWLSEAAVAPAGVAKPGDPAAEACGPTDLSLLRGAPSPQGAGFRDALRKAAIYRDDEESAATLLALETQDVVACRARPEGDGLGAVDVEGQAAGLIARLSKARR